MDDSDGRRRATGGATTTNWYRVTHSLISGAEGTHPGYSRIPGTSVGS